MIGTFKALGMKNRALKSIFLIHAFQILLKGIGWGNVIGFLICWIQKYGKVLKLNEQDYYLRSSIHIHLPTVLLINLAIVLTDADPDHTIGLIGRVSPLKSDWIQIGMRRKYIDCIMYYKIRVKRLLVHIFLPVRDPFLKINFQRINLFLFLFIICLKSLCSCWM